MSHSEAGMPEMEEQKLIGLLSYLIIASCWGSEKIEKEQVQT